jgi:Uma2 family endonuclease
MRAIEMEYGYPYHMTLDEYWVWRETQEGRFEWADGVVYAMAGATRSHNRVVSNLQRMLWSATAGTSCVTWGSDMALRSPSGLRVYYPDLMVVCDEGDSELYETSPCLVVEVLSASTQARDRTVKLGEYSSIPTLINYLMISSDPDDQFAIQHRRAGDLWIHTVHGPEAEVTIGCPQLTFRVSELFG